MAKPKTMFMEENTILVKGEPEVVNWIQKALRSRSFATKANCPKGKIKVIDTQIGTTNPFYDGVEAYNHLVSMRELNTVAEFYIDEKNRLRWRSCGKDRYFWLNGSLNLEYLVEMLRATLRSQNVPKRLDPTVFSDLLSMIEQKKVTTGNGTDNTKPKSERKTKSKTRENTDQKSEPILLESLKGINSSVLSSLKKSGIESLEQLQSFVDENGQEGLKELKGIGEKSSQFLMKVLDEQTVKA